MNKRDRLVDWIILVVVILAVVVLQSGQQQQPQSEVPRPSWSPSGATSLEAFLAANALGEEMALNEAIKATQDLTAPAQGGVQEIGDTIIVSVSALASSDPDEYARQVAQVAAQKLKGHLGTWGRVILGLEASYFGKVFAIEIESGDYFIGDSIEEVASRAWAKDPHKRYYFFIKVRAPDAPARR